MTKQPEVFRSPVEVLAAQPSSDGAGVKLLRVFGGGRPERFDPFLMLDEFGSYEASDYIGGFPAHPHRGFETVTYMLRGKMEHRDHMHNVGLLKDGDVQWMTAGRGIIHSEMPQQTEGQMRGFQLWLNLPAKNKMRPAHYEDVPAAQLPEFDWPGVHIVAIAGTAELAEGRVVKGYFQRPDTEPMVWDVHLSAGQELNVPVPDGHTAMVYVYEGALKLQETVFKAQHLARLSGQGAVKLHNPGTQTLRLMLLAGKPLGEPIVQYGPFVMNSPVEIDQALQDYREGKLTSPAA